MSATLRGAVHLNLGTVVGFPQDKGGVAFMGVKFIPKTIPRMFFISDVDVAMD